MFMMLFVMFLPINIHAELPEYCSDTTGSVVCEISILPYADPGAYAPGVATVPKGATVIFHNTGPEIHTATSTDAATEDSPADANAKINGIFDTGILAPDAKSEPIVMNDDGTFNYFCAVHPDMRGTLIVGAGGTLAPSSNTTNENSATSEDLDFSKTIDGKSITGGELPIVKIKSVGDEAYIIDGTTPKEVMMHSAMMVVDTKKFMEAYKLM